MKLKDLTVKQVVQTTEKNHEAFMKLLDKEGFRWRDKDSYLKDIDENKYTYGRCYRVKLGTSESEYYFKKINYEIIPASKFLKPSKKELLERIEKLEEVVNKSVEVKNPTKLKPGDLCAFADDENSFDSKNLIIRELKYIDKSSNFKYRDSRGTGWRYARKVELKFL